MSFGSWRELSPATRPSARKWHGIADMPGLNRAILFGGRDGGGLNAETWKYEFNNWVLQSPATSPSAREGHILITEYIDLLLFGGYTGSFSNETWRYENSSLNWVQLSPATVPPARRFHGCCNSPGSPLAVMWGGEGSGTPDTSIWEWNNAGTDWVEKTPDVSPSARKHHAMWYDSAADLVYVYGGVDLDTGETLDDLWSWDGTDWYRVLSGTQDAPTARASGKSIAYSPGIARAIAVADGFYATGSITVPKATDLIDGETITITDGTTTEVYEFDTDATFSDVQVDISGAGNSGAVAIALAAAINGGSLSVNATVDTELPNVVRLVNETAGVGATDITTTASSPDLLVTGMSLNDADTWTFNGVSRSWVEQHQTDPQPPLLDGAVLTNYASEMLLFGGSVNGVLVDTHYTWDTDVAEASPYYTIPGVLQGRIEPSKSQAPDGSWVFNLGTDDQILPEVTLDIGDSITITQQFNVLTERLIRFAWHMRYAPGMPKFRNIITGGTVAVRDTDLFNTGDGMNGLILPTSLLTARDAEQVVTLTGAANNANNVDNVRIHSVGSGQATVGYFDADKDQATYPAGSVVGLDINGLEPDVETGLNVDLLGARWRARAILLPDIYPYEEVVMAELFEDLIQSSPNGYQRISGAMHVSKMVAAATVKFELKLIQVTS